MNVEILDVVVKLLYFICCGELLLLIYVICICEEILISYGENLC